MLKKLQNNKDLFGILWKSQEVRCGTWKLVLVTGECLDKHLEGILTEGTALKLLLGEVKNSYFSNLLLAKEVSSVV